MDKHPSDHSVTRRFELLAEKLITPATKGLLSISPLETLAAGLAIALLVWLNDVASKDSVPLLVPPLAGSIAFVFLQRGMTMARSWNVIAGQVLGALGGLIAGTLFPHHLPLAAGLAMCLGLIFQRIAHAYHPPGLPTGLIVAIEPAAHSFHFLLMPVLAGAAIVVAIGWAVHLFEITVLHRLERALGQSLTLDDQD